MVNAPSSAFNGRATRDDLDKLKTQLAGEDARECGEFTVPSNDNNAAIKVSDCVTQALANGVAFTADRTIIGEAYSYESLISDGESNSWLLMQDNSDVLLANIIPPGNGNLTGQVCSQPAVLITTNSSRFAC